MLRTIKDSVESEMERDALISHGASAVVNESLCTQSDAIKVVACRNCQSFANADIVTNDYICRFCGEKGHFGSFVIPYAYKLLSNLLAPTGMLLRPELKTEEEHRQFLESRAEEANKKREYSNSLIMREAKESRSKKEVDRDVDRDVTRETGRDIGKEMPEETEGPEVPEGETVIGDEDEETEETGEGKRKEAEETGTTRRELEDELPPPEDDDLQGNDMGIDYNNDESDEMARVNE